MKTAEQNSCILLTGANGQVGGALLPLLREFGEVCAPLRAELDLADADAVRSYVRALRPRWIVNPAAYTAVDKAESDVELAMAINATAPRVLGEVAAELGIPVLHFSTDYVFDGGGTRPWLETDATGPLGVYGRSKLEGEQGLAASGAAHVILRTSWVYGATGKNFLLTILRLARERERNEHRRRSAWCADVVARAGTAGLPHRAADGERSAGAWRSPGGDTAASGRAFTTLRPAGRRPGSASRRSFCGWQLRRGRSSGSRRCTRWRRPSIRRPRAGRATPVCTAGSWSMRLAFRCCPGGMRPPR